MLVGSNDEAAEELSFFLLLVSIMNFTGAFFDALDFPFGDDDLVAVLSEYLSTEGTIFSSSYFSFASNSFCLSPITCFSLSSIPHFVSS